MVPERPREVTWLIEDLVDEIRRWNRRQIKGSSGKETPVPQPASVNAELQIPPAVVEAYNAQHSAQIPIVAEQLSIARGQDRREWVRLFLEVATLVGVAFTVCFTYQTVTEMQTQSKLTQLTLEEMKTQSKLTERTVIEMQNQTGPVTTAANAAANQVELGRQLAEVEMAAMLQIQSLSFSPRDRLVSIQVTNLGKMYSHSGSFKLREFLMNIPVNTLFRELKPLEGRLPNLTPFPPGSDAIENSGRYRWDHEVDLSHDEIRRIDSGELGLKFEFFITYNNGFKKIDSSTCKAYLRFTLREFIEGRERVLVNDSPDAMPCPDLAARMASFEARKPGSREHAKREAERLRAQQKK